MGRQRIEVAAYIEAFRTWARVVDPDGRTLRSVNECAAHITAQCTGEMEIDALCKVAFAWQRANRESFTGPMGDIGKSCLLSRLVYGGEALRERRCPLHGGRWSGFGDCPAGCNYGLNVTGWLPNELVDDRWPASHDDPKLAQLEAALEARWSLDELTVYGDRLHALGDPRGELIAIDLAGAVTDRRDELVAQWLGPLDRPNEQELWPRGSLHGRVEVRLGFLHVSLDNPTQVRALFDNPAGAYLRRLVLAGSPENVTAMIEFLAMRPHRWLAELAIAPTAPVDAGPLRARAPLLETITFG